MYAGLAPSVMAPLVTLHPAGPAKSHTAPTQQGLRGVASRPHLG